MIVLVSMIALWIVVLVMAFLLMGALSSLGLFAWRLEQVEATTPTRVGRSGLKPGTKAPEFTLESTGGDEVSLGDFAGRRVLLVFVQPGCGPCHDIAPALNQLPRRHGDVQVLVIHNAEPTKAQAWADEIQASFPVLVQGHWDVSRRYEVFATPFAFLIDDQGFVAAKGLVTRPRHLGYLLASIDRGAIAHRAGFGRDGLHMSNGSKEQANPQLPLNEEVPHVPLRGAGG